MTPIEVPQIGDSYQECCHRPTAAGNAMNWWKHSDRWLALCDHCHSRFVLGSGVEMCGVCLVIRSAPTIEDEGN